MAQLAYYDRVILDTATRRRGTDGTLIVRGKFARTGLQTYNDGDGDGAQRVEYRSEDEVRRSAPTFNGIAVTDLHPDNGQGMVTPRSWRDLARGHLQDPVFKDGWLEGDFYLSDGELAVKVEAGERRELSAGYFATPKDVPGSHDGHPYDIVQTAIRGNHVATLPRGHARAGPEAQLLFDSIRDLPPDEPEEPKRDMMADEIKTEVTIGGVRVAFTADAIAAQLLAAELARTQPLEVERDRVQAEADAAKVQIDELKADLGKATDAALLDARVDERTKLVEQVRLVGGAKLALVHTDADGEHALTDTELRAAALSAAGHNVEGKSDAYLEAAIDLAAARAVPPEGTATTGDAAQLIADGSAGEADDSMSDLWEARDRYLDRLATERKEA